MGCKGRSKEDLEAKGKIEEEGEARGRRERERKSFLNFLVEFSLHVALYSN